MVWRPADRTLRVCFPSINNAAMTMSPRFAEAVGYAVEAHGGHTRKRSGSPYVSHLLEVTAEVLHHGGTEIEAIGAMLHDTVEDCGGTRRLRDIRERFGEEVAAIVEGCSDSLAEDPRNKAPWLDRKAAYIAHVPMASHSVRLVSAADKLANARAVLDDYREVGDAVWERFRGGREGTLHYYRAIADTLLAVERTRLTERLDRVVTELCRETGYVLTSL